MRVGIGYTPFMKNAFDKSMNTLLPAPPPTQIGVAVSGGADSLALTYLLKDWCESKNITLFAATVDHGLRLESQEEAQKVHKWVTSLGIHHTILTRPHAPISVNIQHKAREIRYSLLKQWMSDHSLQDLFLAHHGQDQLETFLINLTRGSGLKGLKAMSKTSNDRGIFIHRPLLGFSKEDLLSYLKNRYIPWVEDPSNQNSNFTRIRFRKTSQILEDEGFTYDRLTQTLNTFTRCDEALDHYTKKFLTQHHKDEGFYGAVSLTPLLQEPTETILRALRTLVIHYGDLSFPPRLKTILELLKFIQRRPRNQGTYGKCAVWLERDSMVITREITPQATPLYEGTIPPGVELNFLGKDWVHYARVTWPHLSNSGLPNRCLPFIPTLWNKGHPQTLLLPLIEEKIKS